MTDAPDAELLEQFVRHDSEAAFAALVERHIALVHSVALRHTSHQAHAQDITQAVFIILARKAATLNRKTVLPGWLHNTARLTAANWQRAEMRRIRREQEAFMQSTLEESAPDAVWHELSPLLDDAVSHLGTTDRDALVLRYFQNKSLAEVGAALGMEERAAQKRVVRALEKLRKTFSKRGLKLSVALISSSVAANSVQAAPVGLAKTISVVAIAKGAAVGGSTLALVKGALKLMAWTKTKIAVVTGVAVLLTAGTAAVAVRTLRPQPDFSGAWEGIVQAQAKMRVVLKVRKINGHYTATADSVDQRAKDIPVTIFSYGLPVFSFRPPIIHFEMAAVKGTFDGACNSSMTEMSGTWDQSAFGLKVPLVLKRTSTPSTIPDFLTEGEYRPRRGSDLQGYWLGTVLAGMTPLRLAFKISEPEDGKFSAELDSLDQGAKSLVVSSVSYDKPTVKLEVGVAGGVFEGDLSGTEIKGTWKQMGQPLPLTLTRADPKAILAEAAVLEAKRDYSHAGADDLAGHWKGSLDVGGIKLHLALHVAKQTGGKLSATLDSIDQGMNGLPADTVRSTASGVKLEWKTIGGVYEGKVQDGKLTGTWQQGGQKLPLVFERSAD